MALVEDAEMGKSAQMRAVSRRPMRYVSSGRRSCVHIAAISTDSLPQSTTNTQMVYAMTVHDDAEYNKDKWKGSL